MASAFQQLQPEGVSDDRVACNGAKYDFGAVQAVQKLSGQTSLHLVTAAVKATTGLGNVPLDDVEESGVHRNIKGSQLGRGTLMLSSDVLGLVSDLYPRAFA